MIIAIAIILAAVVAFYLGRSSAPKPRKRPYRSAED